MSRNGSGTYNLPAGNPVTTGTTISSTWANNTLSDMATALTQSIAYDGQTTPVANLPMGGYNHTNVANATARTQYASAGQVEDGTLNYLTSVAGTNAITATAPVSMSAYVAGQTFRFIAAGANTGAVTLNLNSIGAKSVVRTDGSALVSGDIASGAAVQVFYDGTNFQLLNDANGQSETVTTLTATTKVVTPQVGSSSGSFAIQSANTTAITVDSSQNVGIGTNAPLSKISVNGGANFFNTTQQASGTASAYISSPVVSGFIDQAIYGFWYQNTGMSNPASETLGFKTSNTERMRIDSSGNVGIGTSSPSTKLHVYNAGDVTTTIGSNTGASIINLTSNSNASGAYNAVISNTASGENWYVGGLGNSNTLAIRTAGTERMRIDSSGNVLVGTTTQLAGTSFANFSTGNGWVMGIRNTANSSGINITNGSGTASYTAIGFYNNGLTYSSTGTITVSGITTAYTSVSDHRLKENVQPMIGALDTVAQLKPVTYDWIADGSKGQGFIAHELQAVVPDCVTGEKDAVREEEYEVTPAIPAVLDEEGNVVEEAVPAVMGTRTVPVYQGIDTSFLVATLTAAIQELSAKVTALEAQLTK